MLLPPFWDHGHRAGRDWGVELTDLIDKEIEGSSLVSLLLKDESICIDFDTSVRLQCSLYCLADFESISRVVNRPVYVSPDEIEVCRE